MTAEDAARLWQSDDLTAWQAALDGYPAVVEAQHVAGLTELDAWFLNDLPGRLARRHPAYLEPDELQDVVRWKMKRGEWRARNLALVQGNREDDVRDRTQRAFGLVPDPRKPVAEVAELAGVGPATASAVLAAYRPDLYPFLDELVGTPITDLGPPKFTLPYYLRYALALRERATALGTPWDAQRVGLALWSASGGKAALDAD
jgi:hypothetical protein